MTPTKYDQEVYNHSIVARSLGYLFSVSDGRSWSLAENLKTINPYVSKIKERVILIKYILKEIILIHEVLLRSPAVLARLTPLANMVNATVRVISFFGMITDVFYAVDKRLTYTQITFASIATVIDISVIIAIFLFPQYLALAYLITSIYDLVEQNFLYRDTIYRFDQKLERNTSDRSEHLKFILEKSDYMFKKNNKRLIALDICSVAFLVSALFLGSTPVGLILFSVFIALILAKVIVEKTLVNDYKNVSKELYDFCYKYEAQDFSNMFQEQFNLSQIKEERLIQLKADVDQSSQLSVPSHGSVKVSEDLVNSSKELRGFSSLFCQMKSDDRIKLVKECEQVLRINY